jgi:DNA-binding response OmpR family regulator
MATDQDIQYKESDRAHIESMTKAKILVVDDEPVNVELMEEYLSKDYEIVKAYDGNEALRKVETTPPDLILLDIMMPGINGFEVCKILKDNEKTMSIPIIIVTALQDNNGRIKSIEAGADDFLNKPVDVLELAIRVKSLLRLKQYYDALKGDCHFLL